MTQTPQTDNTLAYPGDLSTVDGKLEYRANALIVRVPMTKEEIATTLGSLATIHESSAFWIYDLLLYGEEMFGQDTGQLYHIAQKILHLDTQTIYNRMSVLSRFPPELRADYPLMTIAHYAEVAYIGDARVRQRLLLWAGPKRHRQQRISASRLRRAVAMLKRIEGHWPVKDGDQYIVRPGAHQPLAKVDTIWRDREGALQLAGIAIPPGQRVRIIVMPLADKGNGADTALAADWPTTELPASLQENNTPDWMQS